MTKERGDGNHFPADEYDKDRTVEESPLFTHELVDAIRRILDPCEVSSFDDEQTATRVWLLVGPQFELVLKRYSADSAWTVAGDAELFYNHREADSLDCDIQGHFRGVSRVLLRFANPRYVSFLYEADRCSQTFTIFSDLSIAIDSEEQLRSR